MVPSARYFIAYTHLHPTGFFPIGKVTSSQVLFLFNASISTSMACFHFLSDNASDIEERMGVVFRFMRKVLWVGENFQRIGNLIKGSVAVGCMFWFPF